IRRIARPKLGNHLPVAPPGDLIYVLEYRSLSDLVMLDLVCEQLEAADPLHAIAIGEEHEDRRFFFLNRPGKGLLRRNTMARHSERMTRLLAQASKEAAREPVPGIDALPALVPVMVQWGRAPNREGSLWRLMISENWAVTSRLRRFLNLFLNRHDIVVSFGHALPLLEMAKDELPLNRLQRRCARLLRVQLRDLRLSAMGPDFSHRRTLTSQVVGSRRVRETIERLALSRKSTEGDERKRQRAERSLERRAEGHARAIFSNMSYATVRVLERLLRWFWNRIYDGVSVRGLDRLSQQVDGHTLVYVPSHRSHVDYLLLSYLLFQHGRMIPHIAAGDNLNLPVVGRILRRGGAFFMRRSFRGDALYAAVFSEYLYQVYRRGHCVEFFTEGGRSRTGRLLPARTGLLRITLEHYARGLPRPISFVPVYFSYEKLIEAGAYLDQLRGGAKERESLGGVFRSWRLIRQNFGEVIVNVGEPLQLEHWLAERGVEVEPPATAAASADAAGQDFADLATALGTTLHQRINDAAVLNPVNMVALVTVATPRLAIERSVLAAQIELYRALIEADADHHGFHLPTYSGQEAIDEVAALGFIEEEHTEVGDVISHDPYTAVLMTWYRNNVTHALALPALIACLVAKRRRAIDRKALIRMLDTLYPFLAVEFSTGITPAAYDRWISHLCRAGLIRDQNGQISSPDLHTQAAEQLHLLAQIVMPTLERMYIVIAQLVMAEPWALDRSSLRTRSQQIARKLSRLLGLNAPEFFDGRLFDQFINELIERERVLENHDALLQPTATVQEVMRAATTVIDQRVQQAVQRAA
ncbi:MAG: glycerol-3-phosphate 1-O-acyltransferase PlsB, partial [Pseudomonadota bacterium]